MLPLIVIYSSVWINDLRVSFPMILGERTFGFWGLGGMQEELTSTMGERENITKSGVQLLTAQKANEEARLVERKVCFILDAGSWWGEGGHLSKGKSPSLHPPLTSAGKNFYRQREGATYRNITVSSNRYLKVGHWWSDHCHHVWFRYS